MFRPVFIATRNDQSETISFPEAHRTYNIDLDGYHFLARRGNKFIYSGSREECRSAILTNVQLSMEQM